MGFYQELSRYYDEIFAVDAGEMRFMASLFAGRNAILDIGCGTGNKTALLSETARITGVDSAPDMIAKAGEDNARPGIAYEVLDMARLETRFGPAAFDAAACLGNTLVHLTSPEAMEAMCAAVRRLLVPGGLFVCQILNYDRILDNALTELPAIDTPNTRFSRFYERKGDLLTFRTEIFLKATGETLRDETPLFPLRPGGLNAMLEQAGFAEQKRYGSYQGDPFTENSFVLIVAAVAKAHASRRTIAIKRVYEPVAEDNGFRVLVDRLWPRGREKVTLLYGAKDKEHTQAALLRELL